MKKYLFPFAIAAFASVTAVSCSSSDDEIPVPDDFAGELPKPLYSEEAATFELLTDNVKDGSGMASLKAVSFTESGKAIFEVKTQTGTRFVTYNATIDGDTYSVTDAGGRQIGTVRKAANRASLEVTITANIAIIIGGKPYSFHTAAPVPARMVVNKVTEPSETTTTRTSNLARTWTVAQMNIVLEGDVDMSMLEQSGNLKAFADAAQEAGANLTASELSALNKQINSVTIDKNGLLSLEYADENTEVCDWTWTARDQQAIRLTPHNSADFGNKFLSEYSYITVNFTERSVAFTLHTDIRGEKNYSATLSMVLR